MAFHTWLHLYVYNVGSALGGVETAINNQETQCGSPL